MPKKNLIVAIGALLLVVVIISLSGERAEEEQDFEDLIAQQQREKVVTLPKNSVKTAPPPATPNNFQLTRRLIAERDRSRNTWFVTGRETSSFLELPFAPPRSNSIVTETEPAVRGSDNGEGSDNSIVAEVKSNSSEYLGAEACRECHKEKHSGFIHTAHHKTSGLVGTTAMRGHFTGPQSRMRTSDPLLTFSMSKDGEDYLQQVSFADYQLDFPLNVFTGSAKTGQTFLYWRNNELYQAFVSYLSAFDEWIPSPGYQDRTVDYARAIKVECLECHVTYIEQERVPNVYKPETAVWGISCERCHGPGRAHVQYHRTNPEEKTPKFITHPSDLPRERQLDICGQCHSGAFGLIGEGFQFRPGAELASFHRTSNPNAEGVGGIHTSNQLTRLAKSKCFQQSEMTCTSCHNPHVDQRGIRDAFTASCLNCHQVDHCGMSKKLGASVADNCVDCHMPMSDNENMTLQVSRGSFTVQMIDHYIRVDEKATTAYLSK